MSATPVPDIPGRLSREQMAASLRGVLEGWDGTSPLWVFGYGSLIWKPELAFDRRVTARVHGYHRRLCLWSRINRGTPECPGLVAGLDRGGSCAGVVYRIPAARAASEFERLWEREMFMGSYAPRWLRCRLVDGTDVRALAFVVRHDVSNYAGKLSEARDPRRLPQRQLRPLRHQPRVPGEHRALAARARPARSAPRAARAARGGRRRAGSITLVAAPRIAP